MNMLHLATLFSIFFFRFPKKLLKPPAAKLGIFSYSIVFSSSMHSNSHAITCALFHFIKFGFFNSILALYIGLS